LVALGLKRLIPISPKRWFVILNGRDVRALESKALRIGVLPRSAASKGDEVRRAIELSLGVRRVTHFLVVLPHFLP
jgi:hypothetical protein